MNRLMYSKGYLVFYLIIAMLCLAELIWTIVTQCVNPFTHPASPPHMHHETCTCRPCHSCHQQKLFALLGFTSLSCRDVTLEYLVVDILLNVLICAELSIRVAAVKPAVSDFAQSHGNRGMCVCVCVCMHLPFVCSLSRMRAFLHAHVVFPRQPPSRSNLSSLHGTWLMQSLFSGASSRLSLPLSNSQPLGKKRYACVRIVTRSDLHHPPWL